MNWELPGPPYTAEWRSMIFDRFSGAVVLRVLLLALNLVLLGFLWLNYELAFTYVLLVLLFSAQVIELIHFVNLSNRNLQKFLEAIRYEDFAISFPHHASGKTHSSLNENFNLLIQKLKTNQVQRSGENELFRLVLEQVKTGILLIDENGRVIMANTAGRDLLEVPHFQTWEMFMQKKPELARHIGNFDFRGRKLINIGERELYMDLDTISLKDNHYHLLSFSDLKNEIELKEIEAWHKLILILAHEVMNSVTPISSLSETALKMLSNYGGEAIKASQITDEKIEDLREALFTVVKRSKGMLSFVEEYRKLTKLPAPKFEVFSIKELIYDVCSLLKPQAKAMGVKLQSIIQQERLGLNADRKMLEQVLINLVQNALHALEDSQNGKIDISVFLTEDHIIIEVEDNGKGIPEDILPSVFIPFFSTRKEGSGIGLSLSKNIMKLHKGSIRVESVEGKGSRFILSLPV